MKHNRTITFIFFAAVILTGILFGAGKKSAPLDESGKTFRPAFFTSTAESSPAEIGELAESRSENAPAESGDQYLPESNPSENPHDPGAPTQAGFTQRPPIPASPTPSPEPTATAPAYP